MKTYIHPIRVAIHLRRYLMILVAFLGLQAQGVAQSLQSESRSSMLRAGVAYFGENFVHPGIVLEFEYERVYTPVFSLPLRANLGYQYHKDYNVFFFDVHKGFRKYFRSGLFLEQSVGAGLVAKRYRTGMWYLDEYLNSVPHGGNLVLGFMPSVSAGVGYDLSKEKDSSALLWIRPKVYWDLGFRKLHQPYFALQIGYTHSL